SDYTPFPVNFWEFRNLLVWNTESIYKFGWRTKIYFTLGGAFFNTLLKDFRNHMNSVWFSFL
ncbi:hypothetical protein, partial [Siminovitchia sp. 179-K 8D1 HS]|uniref:hypothetical protein n=1 Tax=Siminovitchia sp. 179-K 8D1 HS TaxID=3142385 RepID=UPI0039A1030B